MNSQVSSAPSPATANAERRVSLNVLFGVPDEDEDVVRASPDGRRLVPGARADGRRSFTLRGSANIAPFLSPARFALSRFYVQSGSGARIDLGPGAILNHIADADLCPRALSLVGEIADRAHRPCFNHPAAVARTTRDGVSRLLSGIPGLIVPKTIRVTGNSTDDVRKAANEAGLRYPILVRVVGSHGGQDRVRIERPEAIGEVASLKRENRPLYLTEFRDFVSLDGLYRKFRIIVAGDDVLVRQCVIGEHWSLHGRHRVAGSEQEETTIFETFDSDWLPSIKPIFSEIARRLDLDYFGVDCNIDSERQVLLFEANACMKVLKNYRPPPNRFEAPIARIKNALETRLASPETWRHAGVARLAG